MTRLGRNDLRALVALLGLFAFALAQAAEPRIFAGDRVAVGHGHARVIVATNGAGEPTSVGVAFDRRVLDGLPTATATQMEWEYVLPMPVGAPASGYDHVALDWNPVGHPPQGVYTVPHFDVHFYTIGAAERQAVSFRGSDAVAHRVSPDATLVPKGFVIPPDTAVEHMGLHGVNPNGPEFHGKPFTHTFIYGYDSGRLIFVEPMVSVAFLKTLSDVTMPVAVPAAYSTPGYYPTRYRIGFDPARGEYRVALTKLKSYTPGSRVSAR